MPIETIRPTIFDTDKKIRAFFTLKNISNYSEERAIGGLNLGFNTNEAPEVIKQNRMDLLDEFNIDKNWIAFANQVHSNRIKIVTGGRTYAETDALITQVPGLALAIQVADCAAVFITDTRTQTIAAIHAGWRGAVGDIIPLTIKKMQELRVQPKNCKAFISPCISLDNFEVGAEVADQFPDQFVDYTTYKKPHVDLKSFLKYQLSKAGLHEKNIEVHPDCTIANEERYYSYRHENDESGRMMGVIQLKPEAV